MSAMSVMLDGACKLNILDIYFANFSQSRGSYKGTAVLRVYCYGTIRGIT